MVPIKTISPFCICVTLAPRMEPSIRWPQGGSFSPSSSLLWLIQANESPFLIKSAITSALLNPRLVIAKQYVLKPEASGSLPKASK